MTGTLVGNPIPLINNLNGFPHPIHPGVIKVVAAAIRHAWAVIRSDPSQHLVARSPGAPDEDRYTEAICQILDQMLSADSSPVYGFTSETFQGVSRSESSCNYSGTSLNKQPDILIRLAEGPLVDARRFVGVYVEAKVVSMSHSLGKYTKEGLSRFVGGEYSWAMQDGLMIAYQKAKYRPISSLADALQKDLTMASLADAKGIYLDELTLFPIVSGCSTHNRKWNYIGGGAPGDIRVWHLWDLEIP